MVSWDKMCWLKKVGGLGLRKMEAVNSAFLSKLTWKLFHKLNLWATQMHAKYSINEHFFKVKACKTDPQAWKCILRNRHNFRKGIRWKVGDETKINFWLDNWCANTNLANLLEVTNTSQLHTSLLVPDFILDSKEWDIQKLRSVLNTELLQLVLATPIPSNTILDSIYRGCREMVIFLLNLPPELPTVCH